MSFTSLEEIQQHYQTAINQAGEKNQYDVVAELRAEQRDMESDFRLRQVAERERKSWVRDAVHDYPLARHFPDLIQGEDEEQVRTSAQQLHEKLVEAYKDHRQREEMERVYQEHLARSQQPPQEEPTSEAAV